MKKSLRETFSLQRKVEGHFSFKDRTSSIVKIAWIEKISKNEESWDGEIHFQVTRD